MTTTTNWKDPLESAVSTRRADCGHRISSRPDAYVWFQTETVGNNREVWTVCRDCRTLDDYMYRLDRPDVPPTRTRREQL